MDREGAEITATARKRSLVVPREHGAWGILMVPLITGGVVGLLAGGHGEGLIPLVLAALTLFWLRTPLESWSGTAAVRARAPEELRLVRFATLLLLLGSLIGLAWLFWGGRNLGLMWIGAAAAFAFLLQFILRQFRRDARTAAQMIGAAGLTSTAPSAYYVATGHLDSTAWVLWAANLLFALNQIQFVQLRIHAARAATRAEKLAAGRGFLAGQAVLLAFLVTACAAGAFPWFAAVAFVPLLIRGFAWFTAAPEPLAIHALGKRELVYACAFGVLIIIGMQLH